MCVFFLKLFFVFGLCQSNIYITLTLNVFTSSYIYLLMNLFIGLLLFSTFHNKITCACKITK